MSCAFFFDPLPFSLCYCRTLLSPLREAHIKWWHQESRLLNEDKAAGTASSSQTDRVNCHIGQIFSPRKASQASEFFVMRFRACRSRRRSLERSRCFDTTFVALYNR